MRRDVVLSGLPKGQINGLWKNAFRAPVSPGERVRIDLSCNSYIDSQLVLQLLKRSELSGAEKIEIDLSTSGVSPDDISAIAVADSVRLMVLNGLNLDAGSVNEIVGRLAGRKSQLVLDLSWNCIAKHMLAESDTVVATDRYTYTVEGPDALSSVILVIGEQFTSVKRPVAIPALRFGLRDDILVDQFFRSTVGFTWSDLVVGADAALAPQRATAAVVSRIPEPELNKALAFACPRDPPDQLPKLKLVPFGSRVNGFGSIAGSDVDLVVVPSEPAGYDWFLSKFRTSDGQKKLCQDFLYHFRRLMFFRNAELVKFARIPVIKVETFALSTRSFVSLDITCLNDVCLVNSELLLQYAKSSESVFRLGHLVKMWAKRSRLVSSGENKFSLPTSYAWIVLCVFFVQERLQAVPSLVADVGRLEEVWGCKNALYSDNEPVRDPTEPIRLPPRSPMLLFTQFLHFIVEEAEGLRIDLCKDRTNRLQAEGINVMDPIEQDRNVAKNVEDWSHVRETCLLYLDRLERAKSSEEFLNVLAPGWNRGKTKVATVDNLLPL